MLPHGTSRTASGVGAAPSNPVLHLAASPSFQRSRPRLAASGDPEGGKAGWGGKVFKSTKKEKKIPPSLRFFFFPWKHFQLYKCPDVGCTAPAPRSAPVANSQRCSSRGGRSAAGALAPSPAAASSREPLAPEHHRQKEGRGRKEGGGVERDIVSPKSIFFYFFTCRHELHCEPRPGSDLIGIGVGRGSFQKYMFILGDFSGFIYRSGSQPVL